LFHFGHNSLEGWEIIFGKQSPEVEFKGQIADKRSSGWGNGAAGSCARTKWPGRTKPVEGAPRHS
ncbi:hypothetical protein, partial [Sphingobacterium sp.]